jgi:hypothetical protein
LQQTTLELTTIAQSVNSMSFLENLENSIADDDGMPIKNDFPEEAGNGEIIQDEIPFELEERLNLEQIERYNERLTYMEEHGI